MLKTSAFKTRPVTPFPDDLICLRDHRLMPYAIFAHGFTCSKQAKAVAAEEKPPMADPDQWPSMVASGSGMKLIAHNCTGLVFVLKAQQRLHTGGMWPLMQHGRRAQEQEILGN